MSVVGRSDRTPFKHWILDSELGRIAGVLSRPNYNVPAVACPFHVIDLCAGDGCQDQGYRCSPAIINKHVSWAAQRNLSVKASYIEKAPNNYASLLRNCEGFENSEFLNIDARDYDFQATGKNQAIFINADPNHIEDMPISSKMAEAMTPCTTFVLTLGCNVGGLKRMTYERRKDWFGYIKMLVDVTPAWHDSILVCLNQDVSQWAYFLRSPSKWSEETVSRLRKKGNLFFDNGVTVASRQRNPQLFEDLQRQLFLTNKEKSSHVA